MEGACSSLWRWLSGSGGGSSAANTSNGIANGGLRSAACLAAATVADLSAVLIAPHVPGDEPARHAASYRLAELAAAGDIAAADALCRALVHPSCEGARRVAIPGLSAAGNVVVPALLQLLRAACPTVAGGEPDGLRALTYAADAVGEAAEGAHTWAAAMELLGDKQAELDAILASEQQHSQQSVGGLGSGKPTPAVPWHQPSAASASKSVLVAVEHIGQRAVAAADGHCVVLACRILVAAMDSPSANSQHHAIVAAASMAVADRPLLGEMAPVLLGKLQALSRGNPYILRSYAMEALKRLAASWESSALAVAQRRVLQGLVEGSWAPPDEDPRQNGTIAGVKRGKEKPRPKVMEEIDGGSYSSIRSYKRHFP